MRRNRLKLCGAWLPVALLSVGLVRADIWDIDPKRKNEIRLHKIQRWLVPALRESEIDLWLVFLRDADDEEVNVVWKDKRDIRLDAVSELIGAEQVYVPAALLFTADGKRVAICSEGDAEYIRQTGIYQQVIPYSYSKRYGFEKMEPLLRAEVTRLNPRKIGINYSELEPAADGLSVGMLRVLERWLGPEYSKRFVSAEDVAVSLWGRNAPEEIELLQQSAEISDRLNREALAIIRPGETTEKDIFQYYRFRMKQLGVEPGWSEYRVPIVNAGDPRSGRLPSDVVVQRGRVVKINGAVRVGGYCVDLNKTAYVLREGEPNPPAAVQQMFDVVLRSLRAAVAAMKPGVHCSDPDAVARQVVRQAGFEEWGYETAHSVGVWIHGLGPTIAPAWSHFGRKPSMKIAVGDVYAVEPTIRRFVPELGVEVSIHLQEMVVIREDGAHYMVPPQTEFILVK